MVQGEPRAKAEEGRISLDRRQDDSASRMPRSSPDVGLQANGGSASGSTLLQPRPSKEDAVPALGSGEGLTRAGGQHSRGMRLKLGGQRAKPLNVPPCMAWAFAPGGKMHGACCGYLSM